ncbi:unnamed protein product, partial [Clonostachys rosea]
FLGPTSSWSFCRRVLSLIAARLPEPIAPPDPWTLDHFDFRWSPLGTEEQPAVHDLPAQDYAVLLAHSVKYHLGPLSPIIEDDVFFRRLGELYQSPAAQAKQSRIWYAQFLLVLALGEAIVNKECLTPVPGTQYAARAMSLIPNFFRVNEESMLVVETLCLAGLYLQSLDLRLEAFQTPSVYVMLTLRQIGQALRICTLEGFHRYASKDEVGEHSSRRYAIVFWATYILDRHFSVLVGAPSSIRDEDITVKLPSETVDSSWATALTLNVKLSRVIADILSDVYEVGSHKNATLLKNTQSTLHNIAKLSRELNQFLQADTHGTTTTPSRVATRLVLSYQHCIVLATRPLVMCVLQKALDHSCTAKSISQWHIGSLLQTCVDATSSILATLKGLSDHDQLDCFIPFHLEELFSSAFLLHVISAAIPTFVPDRSYLPVAHMIFDKMIAKGSHGARIRKMELQRLDTILLSYSQVTTRGLSSSIQLEAVPLSDDTPRVIVQGTDHDSPGIFKENEPIYDMTEWNLFDMSLHEPITLSPTGLLNLAEELNLQTFLD